MLQAGGEGILLQSHSELHILNPVGSKAATRLEDTKPGLELTIYPTIPNWSDEEMKEVPMVECELWYLGSIPVVLRTFSENI